MEYEQTVRCSLFFICDNKKMNDNAFIFDVLYQFFSATAALSFSVSNGTILLRSPTMP